MKIPMRAEGYVSRPKACGKECKEKGNEKKIRTLRSGIMGENAPGDGSSWWWMGVRKFRRRLS